MSLWRTRRTTSTTTLPGRTALSGSCEMGISPSPAAGHSSRDLAPRGSQPGLRRTSCGKPSSLPRDSCGKPPSLRRASCGKPSAASGAGLPTSRGWSSAQRPLAEQVVRLCLVLRWQMLFGCVLAAAAAAAASACSGWEMVSRKGHAEPSPRDADRAQCTGDSRGSAACHSQDTDGSDRRLCSSRVEDVAETRLRTMWLHGMLLGTRM